MRPIHLRLLLVLSLACVPAVQAGSLSAAVGGDAAWFAVDWSAGGGKFALGPSWTHNDDGDIVGFGFHRSGVAGRSSALRAGLGGQVFYVDADLDSGYALGLGGYAHYRLPGDHGLGLGGRAYFAPGVTSVGDMRRYVEAEVRLSYAVFEGAELSLGYTFAEVDFDTTAPIDLDSGVLVGFRLSY